MPTSPRQPRWRRRSVGVAAAFAALGATALVASSAGAASEHKITICHATDSVTNPYVSITVDYHSTIKAGHGDHDGPVYVDGITGKWGDIIPAFDFGDGNSFEGQNLDEGQAILDAGCVGTPATTTTTIGA